MSARLLSAAAALLLGACSVFAVRSGTEEPRFEVLGQQGALEIRRYGPRLAAETLVNAEDEEAARREGFRRLAGFIFGGNRGQSRIAMTAPVAQASSPERIAMTAPVSAATQADGWTIRFFMPASATRETLPVPNDPRITIVEAPAETLAVLRYSGIPSAAAAAAQRAALRTALATGPWQAAGEPFDWFYDPPWTLPPARRNEAVVPVIPR